MSAVLAFEFSNSSALRCHSITIVAIEYTVFRVFVKSLSLFGFFLLLWHCGIVAFCL